MSASSFKPKDILIFWLLLITFSVHFSVLTLTEASISGVSGSVIHYITHFLCSILLLTGLALIPRRSLPINERLFWFCMTTAFAAWLLTKTIPLIASLVELPEWVIMLRSYGYFVFFMAALLSVQFLNSGEKLNDQNTKSRLALSIFGTIVFVGVLFVYLVIVPGQQRNSVGIQQFSVYPFHIIMNVYLATVFLSSALRRQTSDWKLRSFWFGITFLLFLMTDIIDLAEYAELSNLQFKGLASVLSFISYLSLALAFRPVMEKRRVRANDQPQWLPSVLTINVVIVLILHLVGHSTGWFDDEFQGLRETILITWIVVYLIVNNILEKPERHAAKTPERKQNVTPESIEKKQINLDDLPSPVFILDTSGRIIQTNLAASKLTGYSESQLLGELFTGLLSKDEPLGPLLRFSEPWFSASKLFTSGTREVHLQHKVGNEIVCYVGMEQTTSYICVSLVNITRLHEAEQQALSIKDKFLANITHEFRTPLTIIQGAIEESIDSSVSDKLRKQLLSAKSNAARLLKMVEQLLTLSKITSAPKLALVVQPASEIINVCCLQFEPLCKHKSISFTFQVRDNLWIKMHEDSLQVLLYNLLSNAYKYSGQHGQIRLDAKQEEQRLVINISDSGCGMTENDLQRLFKRFHRSESAERSNTFGVGLGLSVVSELVQMHDWQIKVQSAINEGSEFTLTIPLTGAPENSTFTVNTISFAPEESKVEAAQTNFESETLSSVSDTSSQQERLLIIEDNLDMQDYLRHLMAPVYHTEIVGYGKEGITNAMREVPDIIICDLLLPDISGYEVVEHLKQQTATQHIPILMLTAKADIQSKLKGLEKCADDYLTKPFHYKELRLRVQNLLDIRRNMQVMLRQHLNHVAVSASSESDIQVMKPSPDMAQHHEFINQLQVLAEKYYSEDTFGVTHLVENMALSERQLQRKLKATLNLTPSEYIREYRISKSKELLRQGKNVGVVAGLVGFSDQAYFTRCFKSKTGQTPSEFQKIQNG